MRKAEADEVVSLFRGHYNIPLVHVDASELFLKELDGVEDPEAKRKTIGRLFIDMFDAEAKKVGGADFLAQGTLYPDVIESVSFAGGPSVTIKSHHNVGGLPERMNMTRGACATFSGRGAGAGPRARPAREAKSAATLPRPRPRHPLPRRGDEGEARHPAPGGRHLPGGDPLRRPLRRDLAGVRGAAAVIASFSYVC